MSQQNCPATNRDGSSRSPLQAAPEPEAGGINGMQAALRAEFSPPEDIKALPAQFQRAAQAQADRLEAFCESSMQESAELREAIAELCEGLAEIAAAAQQDFAAVNGQAELAKTSLSTLASELDEGRNHLAAMEAALKRVEDDTPRIRDECAAIENRIANFEPRVDALAARIADEAPRTRDELAAMESRIARFEPRLAELNEQQDKTGSRVNALSARIADDTSRARNEFAAMENRIDRFEPRLCELREQHDKTGSRVNALVASVETLQDAAGAIDTKLNALLKAADDIAEQRKRAEQAEARLLELQTAMTALGELFEAERCQRDRLAERLRQAETQLGTIAEREDALAKWQKRLSQAMHLASAP